MVIIVEFYVDIERNTVRLSEKVPIKIAILPSLNTFTVYLFT